MRLFKTFITITLLVMATIFVSCRHESRYDEALTLYNKGVELREAKQNEDAAKCFSDALVILDLYDADNYDVKALKAETEDRLGEIYWLQGLFDDALSMHRDASTLFRKLSIPASLMKSMRNAGRAEASLNNLDEAEINYKEALKIAKTLDDNEFINETSLDLARDIYMETGDYEKTITIVNQALESGAEPYQCHLLLGLAYYYIEDDDNAIQHLEKASQSANAGTRMSACQCLYQIYSLKEDYPKALDYHELYNENMIQAEYEHRSEELQHIKIEYELKMHDNALKAKQKTRLVILFGVLGILAITLIITIILLRQRTLKSHLQAEKNKNQFEAALKKNKIYVTALALSEQITKSSLDFQLDDDSWDDFMNLINLIYNDFNNKLLAQYPSLTTEDLHICCLTRLGFSNQVIAILLNQQTNSYARRKSRIKQEKMNGIEDTRSLEEILEKI